MSAAVRLMVAATLLLANATTASCVCWFKFNFVLWLRIKGIFQNVACMHEHATTYICTCATDSCYHFRYIRVGCNFDCIGAAAAAAATQIKANNFKTATACAT